MLKNFDTDLDREGVTRRVTTKVTVQETVTVRQKPIQSRDDLLVPSDEWEWHHLRDYVVSQIEGRTGPFPRDSRKESSIFKSFLGRWGDQAADIARYAFEVEDGRWGGAPISINRFCKNSDPYFAQVIVNRLTDAANV